MVRPTTLSSVASLAVKNSTGARKPSDRRRRVTSKPSRSVSMTSRMTRSGRKDVAEPMAARQANVALTAPFGASLRPAVDFGRPALVALWDDDEALDRFLAEHTVARTLKDGWHVRLAPLRAFGSWPGVPDDIPRGRTVSHDGPAAVLTLGRLRLTQAPRFLRVSNKAGARVVGAPGLIWATA